MNTSIYYAAKKTYELTSEQKEQLCHLSGRLLKAEFDTSGFRRKYELNEMGYSYHGLMLADSKIVGSVAVVPRKYSVFGDTKFMGLVEDAMVEKEYRGGRPLALKEMFDSLSGFLEFDSIDFVFALPNPGAYLYWKRFVKWRDIGELDFFILPINIGRIKHSFRHLSIFSRIFAYSCNLFVRNAAFEPMENHPGQKIHLVRDKAFRELRYDDTYSQCSLCQGSSFVYKVWDERGAKIAHLADVMLDVSALEKRTSAYKLEDEEGARVAYLIDVFPLKKRTLENAVKRIYFEEKGKIDAILYIGNIGFVPKNLFRVPDKFKPLRMIVAGQFRNGEVDERMFNLSNWLLNLSDFYVR